MVVYEPMTPSSAAVMRLLKRRVARSLVCDGNGISCGGGHERTRDELGQDEQSSAGGGGRQPTWTGPVCSDTVIGMGEENKEEKKNKRGQEKRSLHVRCQRRGL
jgi:hypothetical protein